MDEITNSKEFMERMETYGYRTQASIAEKMTQKKMPYNGKSKSSALARINYIINKKRKAPEKIIQYFQTITSNDSQIIYYLNTPQIKNSTSKRKETIPPDEALRGTLNLLVNKYLNLYDNVINADEQVSYIRDFMMYVNTDASPILRKTLDLFVTEFINKYDSIKNTEDCLRTVSQFGTYIDKLELDRYYRAFKDI